MGSGFFVRHGHVDPGVPGDVPLSSTGRDQARRAADWLADRDIDVVLSSPLRRALETAEVIGHRLGLPAEVDPRLRERLNWGDIEGQDRNAFLRIWDETGRERDRVPWPGAPTAREAGERLRQVAIEHRHQRPVIVAHGGLLQCLHDNGTEGRSGDAVRLRLPHGSVTTYEVTDEDVRLLTVGRVPSAP